MGVVSSMGYTQMYRQALIGVSAYSLVSTYKKGIQVNPDYFVTLLWRRLMGSTLLQVSVLPKNEYLHVFATCRKEQEGSKPALVVALQL
jgi:hypothetical protein